MTPVIRLAEYARKDLRQVEAIRLANGMSPSSVFGIGGEERMKGFLSFFNKQLQSVGLPEISPNDSAKGRILSNKELDNRLILSNIWESEIVAYPVWTGTLVAFNEAGKILGDVIRYTDKQYVPDPLRGHEGHSALKEGTGSTYVFEVPTEYRNEKNAVLVVEHGFLPDGQPTFSFQQDGKNVLVDVTDKSKIVLLSNFPAANQKYYIVEAQHGIPLGSEVYVPYSISEGDPSARELYLMHSGYGAYAGLLVRKANRVIIEGRRDDRWKVFTYSGLERLGALIEPILAR